MYQRQRWQVWLQWKCGSTQGGFNVCFIRNGKHLLYTSRPANPRQMWKLSIVFHCCWNRSWNVVKSMWYHSLGSKMRWVHNRTVMSATSSIYVSNIWFDTLNAFTDKEQIFEKWNAVESAWRSAELWKRRRGNCQEKNRLQCNGFTHGRYSANMAPNRSRRCMTGIWDHEQVKTRTWCVQRRNRRT